MSFERYKPNELIIDHAVEVWISVLRSPQYDNLGNEPCSSDSRLSNTMASALALNLPKNNDEETLKKFGEELKKILMSPVEHNGEVSDPDRYPSYLTVDYGPCRFLGSAAERSGLKMEFPWKTNMSLNSNYLYFCYGYGSEAVYHYPLKDGKWLVAALSGEDISVVIGLIEDGTLDPEIFAVRKEVAEV